MLTSEISKIKKLRRTLITDGSGKILRQRDLSVTFSSLPVKVVAAVTTSEETDSPIVVTYPPAEGVIAHYSAMTVPELYRMAKIMGLPVTTKTRKTALVELLSL